MEYTNGKIYRLISSTGEQYIGSTTQPLSKRLYMHKQGFKNWQNGKITGNCTSIVLFIFGDVDIVLIEEYPCKNKEQLYAREREWIETLDCVNKVIPTRTKEEYRSVNKDKYLQYHRQYYENNKEKMLEIDKEYRRQNHSQLLDYYKKYNKERYTRDKEKINEKNKEKIMCECGTTIRKGDISTHRKTNKHFSLTTNP